MIRRRLYAKIFKQKGSAADLDKSSMNCDIILSS
jgi:hypothetical protein